MLGKLIGNKLMLGALVGVLGGLIVAVLLLLGGVGRTATTAEAAAAKPGEKSAAAAKEKGAHAAEPGRFGPTYVVRDRIVNLADPGGRRYLRFTVAIEFAEHADEKKTDAPPAGASQNHLMVYLPEDAADDQEVQGGRQNDPDKAFQAQIKKYAAAIEDVITSVLSAKTYDEVRSSEGKEAAKHEIKARVQQLVGEAEHVTNVYFTDFVVQ
jgi:flagellar basal body-associated protein FliL